MAIVHLIESWNIDLEGIVRCYHFNGIVHTAIYIYI